jgi:hypothetical protein
MLVLVRRLKWNIILKAIWIVEEQLLVNFSEHYGREDPKPSSADLPGDLAICFYLK